MANVTRYDPFQISGFDPLEDVFKGFFRPVRIEGAPEMQIKMDVSEDDSAYKVHAEIPGVKKDERGQPMGVAEIVVGKRSVISYLLWPLTKTVGESMQEP